MTCDSKINLYQIVLIDMFYFENSLWRLIPTRTPNYMSVVDLAVDFSL